MQVVQRLHHGCFGHIVILLTRPCQEVADIGVEPQIAVTRRPEAEAARTRLEGQHAVDRLLHALAGIGVFCKAAILHQFRNVKQRQSAARRLLGAAVRIFVQHHHQRRNIEGGRARDIDRDGRAEQHAVGQKIAIDRQAAIGRDLDFAPRRHRQNGRAHRHVQNLLQ